MSFFTHLKSCILSVLEHILVVEAKFYKPTSPVYFEVVGS